MKKVLLLCALGFVITSFKKDKVITVWLIGDSTMANYADTAIYPEDYMKTRYPVTGWGQVFDAFMVPDSISLIKHVIDSERVIVKDKAKGGRSTRTFFQEGRWREVREQLKPHDIVIMQFGHNDAAESKPERYVDVEGYKEFLRLFITQTLQHDARPIVLTPVNRSYPWKGDEMQSCHGAYSPAARQVAKEMKVSLIDLEKRSIELFTQKGRAFIDTTYFMNLPAGKYEAYPDGQKDGTHFQPAGATAVAQLVFNGLKELEN